MNYLKYLPKIEQAGFRRGPVAEYITAGTCCLADYIAFTLVQMRGAAGSEPEMRDVVEIAPSPNKSS